MRHRLIDLFCGFVDQSETSHGRAKTCYDSQHDRPLSKIVLSPGWNRIFVKHLFVKLVGHVAVDSEKNYSL